MLRYRIQKKIYTSTSQTIKSNLIMEFYNRYIAVTVAELTREDDGEAVMSMSNYKFMAHRKSISVLRPGKGLAHPALIDWNSLPQRFKDKWVAKYGDPNDLMKASDEELQYSHEAIEFYAKYELPDGSYLKSEFQSEYVLNAAVIQRLVDMVEDQHIVRNRCNMSSRINWEGIYNECEFLREQYGHTLPKNVARLRDKINQFKKEGYASLISGKLCNSNTVKITPEAGQYIISLKRSRFPRRTNQQIFDEFNAKATDNGWKPLKSLSSLVQFLSRPEVEIRWKDVEIGEYGLNMRTRRQNKTIMPTLRDSIWYGDGTKLNLYYKTVDPKTGTWKLATTSVFEVVDAATECLIGYHITPVENFESMYEAYRMALEFSGHLPYELVFDQQGGSKRLDAQDWFSRIATLSRHTAPGNAPSKSIEALFRNFQSQVLAQNVNFTGMNITARMEASHVDMEFLLANIPLLPTYQEMCSIYAECRNKWNAMPHHKTQQPRIEMYLSQQNEATVAITEAMKRNLFMIKTQKAVKCTNHGITIQYKNDKYTYEVVDAQGNPDLLWLRNNLNRGFHVEFDPHNPTADVRLYTKDEYGFKYICDAREYQTIHRALLEQNTEERSFMRKMEWANKVERVRDYLDKQEFEFKYGIAPEQHGYRRPNIKGVSNAEFEKIMDQLIAERAATAEVQAELPDNANEILPDSLGKVQKEVSNTTADMISWLQAL